MTFSTSLFWTLLLFLTVKFPPVKTSQKLGIFKGAQGIAALNYIKLELFYTSFWRGYFLKILKFLGCFLQQHYKFELSEPCRILIISQSVPH